MIAEADVWCVEVDHGYASTLPVPYQCPRQRTKSKTTVHGSLHRCVLSEMDRQVRDSH